MKNFPRRAVKVLVLLAVSLFLLQVALTSNYEHLKTAAYAHYDRYKALRDVYANQTKQLVIDISRDFLNVPDGSNSTTERVSNKTLPGNLGHSTRHEGHNGYQLASFSKNVCVSENFRKLPGSVSGVHVITQKRVLYCPMEKIGTTFWRRLFYMLTTTTDKTKYKQPYDVPIATALGRTKQFTPGIGTSRLSSLLNENSFSFLFVRNPYSRLLSAYIDKLVPPNPYYWKAWGRSAILKFRPNWAQTAKQPIIQTVASPAGHDITFAEFVKFVVNLEKGIKIPDPHLTSTRRACKPCSQHYNYVGRMETFKDDALYIMQRLGMNESIAILKDTFTHYSTDDAITDSIYSPFSWRKEVVKYITWDKALERVWLKLQMRGIISRNIKLNTTNGQLNNVSAKQFVELARAAHRDSDPEDLKKQKDMVKREAFASVPLADIKEFRELFHEDFALYDYDDSPAYILDRPAEPVAPSLFFNYNHLN